MSSSSRRPPRPTREDYLWFKAMETRWSDNDQFGHVNNVVYYSFCDTAVNRYLIEACGFDPAGAEALDFTVESGCRYYRSLSYPEQIDVGIKTTNVGTTSVRWEWALFKSGETEAAAEGHFVHVFVDRIRQRPVPIPPVVRAGLERILAAPHC